MTLNEAIKHCEEKIQRIRLYLKELKRYRFTYSVLLNSNVSKPE